MDGVIANGCNVPFRIIFIGKTQRIRPGQPPINRLRVKDTKRRISTGQRNRGPHHMDPAILINCETGYAAALVDPRLGRNINRL
jgi:hypothetical protein